MDCPTCRDAMITLELADVEIDHCTNCGGIWLDSGELELLLDDSAQAARLLSSFQEDLSATEQPCKCPICDRKMTKVVVGRSDHALQIDRCPRSHGLWFDKGEMEDILAGAQLDQNNRLRRLLADMFGKDLPKGGTKT